MFAFIQILLCYALFNGVFGTPIMGEFRFKNNFEVEHKPIIPHLFKPIEIIKELVTPFGKFGVKHGIGKRDLDNIKTVESEPERVSLMPPPLVDHRYEVEEPSAPVPLSPTLHTQPFTDMGPMIETGSIAPQIPHFVEIQPIQAPPHAPVVITPPPPKAESQPPRGFYTDIARDEAVNEYLKQVEREPVIPVENTIEPEKPKEVPKVEEPANPIIRGSRLALYFGNILLDVFTQILGGGRFADMLSRPITI